VLVNEPLVDAAPAVPSAARSPALPPSRSELLAEGLALVRRTAFRMARRLPPNVEVGDLISAGTEGLLNAIDRYDVERCPRFEAFAAARIRGAILDELRAADAMTRHGRRKLAEVTRTLRSLEAELGRAPDDAEIAARLGITVEQYGKLAADLARGPALARLGEVDPDDIAGGGTDPLEAASDRELRPQLAAAIGTLPERTQMVLAMYYQEECTQAEIGQIFGVTESRVCQILGDAIVRLRAALASTAPARRK
jgi:RNA polymerase sigma factor for flagellar operon FliA